MKNLIITIIILGSLMVSCNQYDDWDFPDFEFSGVYFAYQSPVRTLVLGKDIFDNSLDNEGKFMVYATLGGVYENENDVQLNVAVDNSLAQNLLNQDGDTLVALPASYYTISGEPAITIPSGSFIGGMEIQLTDAFFNDPLSVQDRYILPVVIQNVAGADSVLSGQPLVADPDRRLAGDWEVQPKDYVLYAVKYINQWHGNYLRRGVEVVDDDDNARDVTNEYEEEFVEYDQVVSAVTTANNQISYSFNGQDVEGNNIPITVLITFDNAGNCTISEPAGVAYTASGTGTFVENGDSWGNKERDQLNLQFTVDLGTATHTFDDILVMRDRGVAFELFDPIVY